MLVMLVTVTSPPLLSTTCRSQTREKIGTVRLAVRLQDCRHIPKLWIIGGPALQHRLVQLDDGLGERLSEDFQEVRRLAALCLTTDESLHNFAGEKLQVSRKLLQYNQEDHCQPVEHVMHCRGREGSPERLPVGHLGEADDGVGDAGPNVRPHHHRYGGPDRDVSGHQANNDGGGGGGGLD